MSNSVPDKLVTELERLSKDQQLRVLDFVKSMNTETLLNQRAHVAEDDIQYGQTTSLEQFNEDFQKWKSQKRKVLK